MILRYILVESFGEEKLMLIFFSRFFSGFFLLNLDCNHEGFNMIIISLSSYHKSVQLINSFVYNYKSTKYTYGRCDTFR